MGADVTPTSSLPPFASTRRSLLSRITLPLKARTRNLADFHIRPQEPHRRYSPGDVVKGAVVLTVAKPIRVTHLTVCLHGFVRVFKRANDGKEPLPADPGLTTSANGRKSQYFGNGHASLFQDEITLCGEGRLESGIYEFNFEMEFPSKGLPTSIDFERGTIAYMITATITRPTSIAATSSCEQKLSLVETIDIGLMRPPKPRTISLEPISKRSKIKRSKNKEGTLPEASESCSGGERSKGSLSSHPDESASESGPTEPSIHPQSPEPSEALSTISTPTGTESTEGSTCSKVDQAPSSAKFAGDGQRVSSSLDDKTITATIELLKSGCLPGDNLPLRISIKHTKGIKSLHGIIITLYRQGRIDSAPPLSRFVDMKGKGVEKLKHEEYYPKSKTGLSGLSLSSAGSSSLFRKDLAQTFAPLIVDPSTLTAVVNASIRVPEDAFPTISNVPGEMISFKYHVEVVVDLGGKLAGQQRHQPRVGSMALPAAFGPGTDGNPNAPLVTWRGSIVDTDHLRREKSVVACLLEVIVGSIDSSRKHGRANSSAVAAARPGGAEWPDDTAAAPAPSPGGDLDDHRTLGEHEYPYPYNDHYDDPPPLQYPDNTTNPHDPTYEYPPHPPYSINPPPPPHASIPVPPPEILDPALSDKDRARLAEARLLPSEPPTDDPHGSSATLQGASAPPPLEDEEEEEEVVDLYGSNDDTPRAPYAPVFAPAVAEGVGDGAGMDKQERERLRMMGEASAPPVVEEEEGEGVEGEVGEDVGPSAPGAVDYGGYGGAGIEEEEEGLPRYER